MTESKNIRVRVAPSPTGDPHVGTAYISLFNYVFAKKFQGKLILRLEDTDQKRSQGSSEQQIFDSMKWLGLSWDEGPDVGGEFGPYRQSERKEIHQEYARKLQESGHAYSCFCTSERLKDLRESQRKSGGAGGYDGKCRDLTEAEVNEKQNQGLSSVLRLKVPKEGSTSFSDAMRGEIEINHAQIDDQVLIKTDGFPTYHLANVVDDHLMEITHVIRAEEWISSTPKHVILYEAFGWKVPVFAHMPLLRNADKSKISKRKNPVSLNYYRRKGILPEAMLNYLGLMGWSFGEDKEIFTVEDMLSRFELKDVHLGGPIFDIAKLSYINQQYIQKLDADAFVKHLRDEVFTNQYLKSLQPLYKERLECFEQFVDKADFLFNGSLSYENIKIIPKNKELKDLKAMLKDLLEELDELYVWDAISLQELMNQHCKKIEWKPRDYFMPIRMIVTGRKDSPPLAETMAVVGREMVRFRIRDSLKKNLV